MTATTGWCWQLATTKKRHYFDGPRSLCGRADQRTDAKRWSRAPGQTVHPATRPRHCSVCFAELEGSS